MEAPRVATRRVGWFERIAPLGAIVFAVWLLIAFLMSEDTGDTAQDLIDYARSNEGTNIFTQILALATPILLGSFVAALASRMRDLEDLLPRALTIIGGTLLIAFFSTAITFWTAPLLESGEVTTAGAEAYMMYDDAGWVLLGTAGISAGMMIIGVSLAAMRLRWVPTWLGWVSVVLGLASFATVAFVGLFAWVAWLIGAGALMLWRDNRAPAI